MTPINTQCKGCGRTVQAPESMAGKQVKCPGCGGQVKVPGTGSAAAEASGELELSCRDCGRVFNVPLDERGEVVSCPSCGSWIKAGRKHRSILTQDIPLPFQLSSSVLRGLRFFAGFNLIIGLAAAVWVGISYGTRPAEELAQSQWTGASITIKQKQDETGRPTGDLVGIVAPAERPSPTADGDRVINPIGVAAAFALAVAAILGTVILMALYWILQNVQALHYSATRQAPEAKPAGR